MINLSDVSFSYPAGEPVLQGLDLSCEESERVGIVGGNGVGKTTLLHLVMGLLTPQQGMISLLGEPRRTEKDFREARKRIGFVFQNADDQLFCPTVAEDIAFGPRNLGKSAEEAHAIVHRVLDMLDIDHLEARVTYQLSGGEKRLVALGTVLAMEPDLLVLDEPTTGLDEKTEGRLIDILGGLGKTLLLVSHDKEFLARTTSRTVKLDGGKLVNATA